MIFLRICAFRCVCSSGPSLSTQERLSPASPRKVDDAKVAQSEQKVLDKKKAGSHVPPAAAAGAKPAANSAPAAESGYA